MAAGRFRCRLTALRRRKPPQRAHSGLDSALVWTRERVWTRNMNFADEAAFADEDEADEVEETTDATAAEVARLQAEVDRWQKKVSELADASEARAALFADADEDGSGLEDRLGLEAAVDAMSAAQSAMQQRVGRMSSGSSASKGATGSGGKAPPMMVMRPMTGPTKGK
jgi:hypothetical protein